MTRFYGALLFATLVAACGSNNNGNGNGACGDGIVNGNEQCDDGNTTSGDGCSSVCTNELGKCGDGIVDVATETCDDGNTVSGDGCSSTCQTETSPSKCGNGVIDSGEACDDANTASSDGCSSTCQVETGYTCTGAPSVCTMGMGSASGAGTCAMPIVLTIANGTGTATGDTTNATDQVTGERCDGSFSSGTGNDQIVSFTLAAAADVTIAVTTDADAVLRLTSTVCDTTTEISDTVGHDGCADLGFETDGETLTVQRLAAGTYFVVVDSYDDSESGPWSLTVTTSAPTGACGDGNLDSFEECDDHNMVAGDRCSATCTLESDTAEVEPNDDIAHAQPITAAHHIVRGSLSSATDIDLYKFTLTATTAIRFETYDGEDPNSDNLGLAVTPLPSLDCIYAQHIISVFDVNDANADVTDDGTSVMTDSFSGDYDDVNEFESQCAYLGAVDATPVTLPAGTYVLKIEDSYMAPEKVYAIDVQFGGASAAAVAPGAGDLKINEVMLADGTTADTNCDGSTTDTVDEFVELVNVTDHALDLTGVTISDAMQVRHTFAAGASGSMTLDPGKAMVVWGGGAPACPGVTNWFIASTGSLGLNDAGDTVTVKSGTTTVATATFAASTTGKSFNASPDVTGTTYAVHDTITGHAGAFTPGKKNDGTAF